MVVHEEKDSSETFKRWVPAAFQLPGFPGLDGRAYLRPLDHPNRKLAAKVFLEQLFRLRMFGFGTAQITATAVGYISRRT